jgi:protein-S-isoprenylcysteine O-methyltransferase Ste14
MSSSSIGEFLFRIRSYTPLPLLLVVLFFAQTTRTTFLFGFPLVILGEALRLWGVAYAGEYTRARDVNIPELVTDGPYAFIRHPLYVGNFFLMMGFCVIGWAWMPWMLLLAFVLFWIQYYFIIHLEETHLSETFGEEYIKYKAAVPMFLPFKGKYKVLSESPQSTVYSPASIQTRWEMAWRNEDRTKLTIAFILVAFMLRAYLRMTRGI